MRQLVGLGLAFLITAGAAARAQEAPPRSGSSIPVATAILPEPGVDLHRALQNTDQIAAALVRHPTPANAAAFTAIVKSLRYDRGSNAILVGRPVAPIFDAATNDERYRANLARLAALHLASIRQPVVARTEATRETPVRSGQGTSNLRVIDSASLMRRSFVVRVFDKTGLQICTGILVSSETVMTAAHCACDFQIASIKFIDAHQKMQTRAVRSRAVRAFEPADVKRACAILGARPIGAEAIGHDILLLGLQTPIDPQDAAPIQFAARREQLTSASIGIIAGFGSTRRNGKGSVGLGWPPATTVALRMEDCAECGEFYSSPTPRIAGKGGNDTCNGDSGGPLLLVEGEFVENELAQNKFDIDAVISRSKVVLAGVTSRGLAPRKGSNDLCGFGGIYEFVQSEWLQKLFRENDVPLVIDVEFKPF